MTPADIVILIAATLTALMAGLFFAFSFAVNLGLARLSNTEYVATMQFINRRIQNPIFFIVFFGAPIFLALSTFLHFGNEKRFGLLITASVVYVVGTFGVTVFGNVPLNNQLESFDLKSAAEEEAALQRANFEARWNNLNMIRTVSSTLAIILIILACFYQ